MLDDILKIEKKERKIFKRHFLKGVILELVFNKNIKEEFCNNNFYKYFKNKNYTQKTKINNMDFKITIDNDNPKAEQTNDVIGYSYTNPTNHNIIQIINNKFVFVQNTYRQFDNFLEEIKYFLENIINNFSKEVIKVGFRKINSIVISDIMSYKDITELFNEKLFGFIKTNIFDFDLLENYRDNFTLTKNNTTCIINTACLKIKNIENSYEVNIDNDIILNENIDNLSLYEILSDMNQMHFNVFCWITSEKMKSIMNEEKYNNGTKN